VQPGLDGPPERRTGCVEANDGKDDDRDRCHRAKVGILNPALHDRHKEDGEKRADHEPDNATEAADQAGAIAVDEVGDEDRYKNHVEHDRSEHLSPGCSGLASPFPQFSLRF
jgi:hypothetical protein